MTTYPWIPGPAPQPVAQIHSYLNRSTAAAEQALLQCDTVPEPDWQGPAAGSWQEELDNLRAAVRSLDSSVVAARRLASRLLVLEQQS